MATHMTTPAQHSLLKERRRCSDRLRHGQRVWRLHRRGRSRHITSAGRVITTGRAARHTHVHRPTAQPAEQTHMATPRRRHSSQPHTPEVVRLVARRAHRGTAVACRQRTALATRTPTASHGCRHATSGGRSVRGVAVGTARLAARPVASATVSAGSGPRPRPRSPRLRCTTAGGDTLVVAGSGCGCGGGAGTAAVPLATSTSTTTRTTRHSGPAAGATLAILGTLATTHAAASNTRGSRARA